MDRRTFIKLTTVTGATATLASCGNPENQIVRFIPDDDIVPGIAAWKPSICPLCQAGCGLQVRVMDADADVIRDGQRGVMKMLVAKKLEGHPQYPINHGGLCPRGQAAIQITYHPDRLTHPLKRSGARGSGEFQQITWDEAVGELVSRLDTLADGNGQQALAFLSRRRPSRRQELVSEFLARFGAPPPILFELFDDHVLRHANRLSFGRDQLPTFDLGRARYVLAFGADFLGTWNSPVAQSVAYGRMRQDNGGIRGKLVQVESRMSLTGANADEWIPLRAGSDGVLALGLAHVILRDGLRSATAAGPAAGALAGWGEGLPNYTPERVEALTGVSAARVQRLAREFASETPAVALIGGSPLAQTNGLFHALAVNALNALVGSVGTPGGVFFTPAVSSPTASAKAVVPSGAARSVATLAADLHAAQQPPVQVLLLDEANPVFATPRAWRVREALENVPFIASFGTFIDETSILADLILPDHSFLESWVDALPESGALVPVAGVAAPVMRPLHETRAMPDVLLEVVGKLRRPLTTPLPWKRFDEMLRQQFAALPVSEGDAWTRAQAQGGWWGELPGAAPAAGSPAPRTAPPSSSAVPPRQTVSPMQFVEPQFDGDASGYPFNLLPYPSQTVYDGSLAHLPWLQEMPDPLTSAMWSSWVEINPQTAARLGIAQGDVVEIASQHGSLRTPAWLSPGIGLDTVAIPVGQGHQSFTRYASGRGANPVSILAPLTEPVTGALAWAATRVRVTRVGDANGQLILFAGGMREEHDPTR